MFCPHCGTPDQTLRFCTACGTPLQTPVVPAVNNTINVNIQVGAPTIVTSGEPAPSPAARAIKTVWRSIQDAMDRKRAVDELRRKVASELRTCDVLVQEIESSVGLLLIPPASPVHRIYMQALELRRQCLETVYSAIDHDQLVAASEKVAEALRGLAQVKSTIERDPNSSLPVAGQVSTLE